MDQPGGQIGLRKINRRKEDEKLGWWDGKMIRRSEGGRPEGWEAGKLGGDETGELVSS